VRDWTENLPMWRSNPKQMWCGSTAQIPLASVEVPLASVEGPLASQVKVLLKVPLASLGVQLASQTRRLQVKTFLP